MPSSKTLSLRALQTKVDEMEKMLIEVAHNSILLKNAVLAIAKEINIPTPEKPLVKVADNNRDVASAESKSDLVQPLNQEEPTEEEKCRMLGCRLRAEEGKRFCDAHDY